MYIYTPETQINELRAENAELKAKLKSSELALSVCWDELNRSKLAIDFGRMCINYLIAACVALAGLLMLAIGWILI